MDSGATSRSPASRSATSKSRSNRAVKPPTVSFLEQVAVEVVAEKSSRRRRSDVQYVFLVRPKTEAGEWRVALSFRRLREFHRQLLEAMALGHVCAADCPWLYSFLRGRFPKECHLYSSSSYVVCKRVAAIRDCFDKLRDAITSRGACNVLTHQTALLVVRLLTRELPEEHPYHWSTFLQRTQQSPTDPLGFPVTPTANEDAFSSTDACECTLCAASTPSDAPTWSIDDQMQPLVKLPCGHGFHDECIVTWLNERLECPQCRQPVHML